MASWFTRARSPARLRGYIPEESGLSQFHLLTDVTLVLATITREFFFLRIYRKFKNAKLRALLVYARKLGNTWNKFHTEALCFSFSRKFILKEYESA